MISRRTAICLTAIGLSATRFDRQRLWRRIIRRGRCNWVVGYPPGGATDIIARLIGQRLSEKLGQQFVIENKPGAGNNIATESVDQCRARRLHGAAGQSGELHQRLALRQPEVQLRPRHRAGRLLQPRAERDDGQQGRAGEDRRRVHRLCEGQSGQGQHGVVRQRHLGASVRRNVHGDDRRQDAARALSRRGAGDHRHARRPGAGDLRQHALDHPAHQIRYACARWR